MIDRVRTLNHVVVVGASTTAVRLTDELLRAGEKVVAILPSGTSPTIADEMESNGIVVLAPSSIRERELRAAGVGDAKAVAIVGMADIEMLRLALIVDELAPAARLVVEAVSSEFAHQIAPLIPRCVALSSVDLAAPSFEAAAISDGLVQTFEIADRSVVTGPRNRVGGEVLAVLGDSEDNSGESLLSGEGDIVLGSQIIGDDPHVARRSGAWGAFVQVFDSRLRVVLWVLLALVIISVLYFRFVAGLPWSVAFYDAVTAATLNGQGDFSSLHGWAMTGAIVIQILGLILSSGITAVIVDALISSRISALMGGLGGKPRNHIVVLGLGRIGSEVAIRLSRRGYSVVAVEVDDQASGVLRARRARIPVIIADNGDPAALQQINVEQARAVLAVTNNDAVNLQSALAARGVNPDCHVVVRLYDHQLAERVNTRLDIGTTRSVSMLAAPSFAAAALGRRREHTVGVGRRIVILTELQIRTGSKAENGIRVLDIDRVAGVHVLATSVGDTWEWHPLQGQTLRSGDRIAVAASRRGLGELLRQIKQPHTLEWDAHSGYEA